MSGRQNAQTTRLVRGAGTTALALAIGVGPLFALMPAAQAKGSPTGGGNNAKGSLTVHGVGTQILDQRNEPHVCAFVLVADNYDPAKYRGIAYTFSRIAPSKPVANGLDPGTITLSVHRANGTIGGQTGVLHLPDGHYKPHGQLIDLNGSLENGQDNFKAFWVKCNSTPPTTPPTTPPPTTPPPTTPPPTTPPPVTETTPPVTETTPPVTETTPPTTGGGDFTGGGGNPTVSVPVAKPVTKPVTKPVVVTHGSGKVVAKTLPFTGRNTGTLALWGLTSLAAGVGMVVAGNRRPAAR